MTLRHVPFSQPVPTDYRPYFEAMLKSLNQLLTAITQLQVEVLAMRNQLKAAVAAGTSAAVTQERREEASQPELPGDYDFPLDTLEDLERLNQELSDLKLHRRLECHLYNLGGTNFRASLRAAGATLMSPKLQGCLNVTRSNRAGHQKAAFKKLSDVSLALYNAVHERHGVERQAFTSYLGEWLSTWRDRMEGGKKNRVGENKNARGQNVDEESVHARETETTSMGHGSEGDASS